MAAIAVAGLVAVSPAAYAWSSPLSHQVVTEAPSSAFEQFLDRLMMAESGGRTNASNPRSSALGPFQFIKSTFIDVTRRHFADEIVGLSETQVLDRRTDPEFSRRAAAIYCREIVDYLKEQGIEPTFGHLRLAYLLGPGDAARVLQAKPTEALVDLLAAAVIRANPFMANMSVADLISRSSREVEGMRPLRVIGPVKGVRTARNPAAPGIEVRCNIKLPSCRKFVALAEKAATKKR